MTDKVSIPPWRKRLRSSHLLTFIVSTFLTTTIGLADEVTDWQPQHSRVFLISLTRFSSDHLHSFTTDDRLDDRFAQLFRDRGVPANQVVLLKDVAATVQNIEREFTDFLRRSRPDETLIFYFGSHGSYDRKSGDYSFCAYNNNVSFSRIFDHIERDFKGTSAILLADCCYSGGIIELAKKRQSRVSYACLSSTFAHQTAWSGWRYVQCLMRGLSGNPVVDLNNDGHVDLDELARYTASYMAFSAEGKPMFHVTGSFNPKLRLSTASKTKHPRVGELLEVHSKSGWEKAEVIDANQQRLKIHFTRDTKVAHDAWFSTDQTRPYHFPRYAVGSQIEVKNASEQIWRSAKVLQNWESLSLCHRDGSTSDDDEWFGPERIRNCVSASWKGTWHNSLDESGPESLDLIQDSGEHLRGTWSGNIPIRGERIGNDVIYFEATTPGRFYRCAGRVEGRYLILNYVAHRTDSDGDYHGWAKINRKGEITDAARDQQVSFSGRWSGVYENSRGGSGNESLSMTETNSKLQGTWSGVEVIGERLGNAMFFLEGTSGNVHYHVIGHVAGERLILNYDTSADNEHYTGRSTLDR